MIIHQKTNTVYLYSIFDSSEKVFLMLNYQSLTPSPNNSHKNIKLNHWIDIKQLSTNTAFYHQLAKICQQHQQDRRWIMIIDPQKKDIELLKLSTQIEQTKILQLNSQQITISLENIHTLLAKGTCAAVVLCNAKFSHQQLLKLNQFAQQGKTHCLVLN